MHNLILSIVNSNMKDADKVAAIAAIAGLEKAKKDLYKARVKASGNKRFADMLLAELGK